LNRNGSKIGIDGKFTTYIRIGVIRIEQINLTLDILSFRFSFKLSQNKKYALSFNFFFDFYTDF
jgi:hypothetical protein